MQHVEGLTIDCKARPQHHCPACAAGKEHCDPFPASSSRASRPPELVHTDMGGPVHVPGTGGVTYRLTITGDFTRWRWLKLVTNKRKEQWLKHSALPASWSPSRMTREVSSLGIGLQPGARSMAYKHNTLCTHATPEQNGEPSVASET